jgi:hypothetical protein
MDQSIYSKSLINENQFYQNIFFKNLYDFYVYLEKLSFDSTLII